MTKRLNEIKEVLASLGVWCDENALEMHIITCGENEDTNDSNCIQIFPEIVE